MTTEELLKFKAGTKVMDTSGVVYIKVKNYEDKLELQCLYFNTVEGTLIHASHLENTVMRFQ